MPRKGQALSLSEFHEAIGPTSTADAEVLPDGPSGTASDVPVRKWISEWDGRAELLPVEIPPPAAPTPLKTEPEFKEALDLCLSEFFSSGDLAEATRCRVLSVDYRPRSEAGDFADLWRSFRRLQSEYLRNLRAEMDPHSSGGAL